MKQGAMEWADSLQSLPLQGHAHLGVQRGGRHHQKWQTDAPAQSPWLTMPTVQEVSDDGSAAG